MTLELSPGNQNPDYPLHAGSFVTLEACEFSETAGDFLGIHNQEGAILLPGPGYFLRVMCTTFAGYAATRTPCLGAGESAIACRSG